MWFVRHPERPVHSDVRYAYRAVRALEGRESCSQRLPRVFEDAPREGSFRLRPKRRSLFLDKGVWLRVLEQGTHSHRKAPDLRIPQQEQRPRGENAAK